MTSKKTEQAAEARLVQATRVNVGAMELLDYIGRFSGIDQNLYDIFPDDESMAQKILSISRYWLYTGGHTLPGIEKFQMTHTLPYVHGITEDIYHKLFEDIGFDYEIVQNYFKKRVDFCDCAIIVAYDASAESTYGHLPFATAGFDKEGIGLPTIKYIVLYSITNNQPIAYARTTGNISDMTTVLNALLQLEALGVPVDEVVTDNGYAGDINFAIYFIHKYNFLTRAKNTWKWIKALINKNYRKLGKPSTFCDEESKMSGIHVTTTREVTYTFPEDWEEHKVGETMQVTIPLHVYIYQNTDQKSDQDQALRLDVAALMDKINSGTKLESLTKDEYKAAKKFLHLKDTKVQGIYKAKMNDPAIEEVNRYHGILVLVGTKKRTAGNALIVYRLREKIEEDINIKKDDCDGKRPRASTPAVYDGKIFVQFVTMGYYHSLYSELNRVKKEVDAAIRNPAEHKIDSQELQVYKKLKTWLHNKSLEQILQWFDNKEMTSIHTLYAKRVITSETTMRDKLFVKLFTKSDESDETEESEQDKQSKQSKQGKQGKQDKQG